MARAGNAQTRPSRARWFIWLLSVVISTQLSGVVFGWPALVKMMKDVGIYADGCDDSQDPDEPCREQEVALSLVFSIGFFCTFGGRLATGLVLDRFGAKFTSTVSILLGLCGALLFAYALKERVSGLYEVGFGLLCSAGNGVHIGAMHISNLFPERKGTILSSYSVGLQCSAFLFTVLSFVVDGLGVQLWEVMVVYGGWLGIALVANFLLVQPLRRYSIGDRVEFGKLSRQHFGFVHVTSASEKWTSRPVEASGGGKQHSMEKLPVRSAPRFVVSTQPFLTQVRSRTFALLVVFKVVMMLNVQFYLALVQVRLEKEGDSGTLNVVFNALSAFLCIPLLPVAGYLLDKGANGLYHNGVVAVGGALLTNTALALTEFSKAPVETNIVGFFLWAGTRFLFFTFFFSFVTEVFGFKSLGRVVGVVSVVAALVGLVATPLLVDLALSLGSFGSGYVACIMVGVVSPLVLYPRHVRLLFDAAAASDQV